MRVEDQILIMACRAHLLWGAVQVHAQQELRNRLCQAEEVIQQRDACLSILQEANALLFKHAQAVGSDVQVRG